MTRGLVIAALAITGCGAAQPTTTVEPAASPRSCPEPSCPEPSCPAPPPSLDCPISASELGASMRGSGFWCWKQTVGDLIAEGECYRLEVACNDWRKSALENGAAPTECTRRERAVCFDLTDLRKQKVYFRCLFTPEECEAFRAAMAEKYPEYEPGACRLAT